MAARLLFVGDMHLGRRPSGLPEDLGERGLAAADFTPAAAWRRCVAMAIERRVDAVVLAGDVVEGIDDRFEAYGHLQAGVRQLAEAGIPVFGVAGNHDVEALPRLARQIPGFQLLGADGRWQSVAIQTRSGPAVRLLGWSFPARVVTTNPLAELRIEPVPGQACLGVLHCDLDAGRSRYAPVTRSQLESAAPDAWLLGHVHRPDALSGERPIGYLGSLVGLDPGEAGCHGPWLVEVEGPGRVEAKQWPLAPLRWERQEILLAEFDTTDEEDLADALSGELLRAFESIRERVDAQRALDAGAAAELRLVGCRIRIGGRGRHHAGVRELLGAGRIAPSPVFDGVHYFVEKLEQRAAPDFDLDELARGSDPPALLARDLCGLLADEMPELRALEHELVEELQTGLARLPWNALGEAIPQPTPESARELLLRAGTRMLETLLAQRTTAAASGRLPEDPA